MTAPVSLDDVIAALTELDQLDDCARSAAARRLGQSIPAVLRAYADAAVFAATRTETRPTIAARMGLSLNTIDQAITRHRKAQQG